MRSPAPDEDGTPTARDSDVADALPLVAPIAERERTHVPATRTGKFKVFFKLLVKQVMAHDLDDAAAMLAYYAILAVFPMLVFTVSLTIAVLPESALIEGVALATKTFPASIGQLVTEHVLALSRSDSSGAFAFGTAAIALFGASRAAAALMLLLDRLHSKKETRPWLRRQVTAILVTFAVAILVVIALALLVAGPIVGHWIADRFQLGAAFDVAWTFIRWAGAGFLVMFVWAVAYKFLPNTDAPFRVFTPGAMVGVALWLGISRLFQLYLDNFGRYEATYGALGTGIILLTWVWLTNLSLLIGAEINDVLADLRRQGSEGAAQLATETAAR